MIHIDFKDLPNLPQADRRPVNRVSKDEIKNTGVGLNPYCLGGWSRRVIFVKCC